MITKTTDKPQLPTRKELTERIAELEAENSRLTWAIESNKGEGKRLRAELDNMTHTLVQMDGVLERRVPAPPRIEHAKIQPLCELKTLSVDMALSDIRNIEYMGSRAQNLDVIKLHALKMILKSNEYSLWRAVNMVWSEPVIAEVIEPVRGKYVASIQVVMPKDDE